MGIPVSLILIAVGAILTFAINQHSSSSVDIDVAPAAPLPPDAPPPP
jgi:hypothetical protein